MKKYILLFLCCGIVACKNQKITASSPERFAIENLAEVIKQGRLQKVYPEAQVVNDSDLFEEGTVNKEYSILYPDTPEEILIVWEEREEDDFQEIRFSGTGRWKSKKGIAINSSYNDLLELNKAPLKVYGFGWDYSGAVDWNEGELENSGLFVFLAPTNAPPQAFYGDHILEATPEELERLNLRVSSIALQNPGGKKEK